MQLFNSRFYIKWESNSIKLFNVQKKNMILICSTMCKIIKNYRLNRKIDDYCRFLDVSWMENTS